MRGLEAPVASPVLAAGVQVQDEVLWAEKVAWNTLRKDELAILASQF